MNWLKYTRQDMMIYSVYWLKNGGGIVEMIKLRRIRRECRSIRPAAAVGRRPFWRCRRAGCRAIRPEAKRRRRMRRRRGAPDVTPVSPNSPARLYTPPAQSVLKFFAVLIELTFFFKIAELVIPLPIGMELRIVVTLIRIKNRPLNE